MNKDNALGIMMVTDEALDFLDRFLAEEKNAIVDEETKKGERKRAKEALKELNHSITIMRLRPNGLRILTKAFKLIRQEVK